MSTRRFSMQVAIAIAALILSQGGAFLLLRLLGAGDQPYALLVINTVFLVACIMCVRLFRMSTEDIGLKLLLPHLARHTVLCLVILSLYLLYCLLGVRISGLRPFTSATMWALLAYLVVALAEEIYFRGILYRILSNKYSGRAAAIGSAVFFAAFHLRQGPVALLRLPTGLLWASIRYSSGMIFLLAFPVHFAYNAVWLLFQGNWDSPPSWAVLVPLGELLLGLLIIILPSPVPRSGTDEG